MRHWKIILAPMSKGGDRGLGSIKVKSHPGTASANCLYSKGFDDNFT